MIEISFISSHSKLIPNFGYARPQKFKINLIFSANDVLLAEFCCLSFEPSFIRYSWKTIFLLYQPCTSHRCLWILCVGVKKIPLNSLNNTVQYRANLLDSLIEKTPVQCDRAKMECLEFPLKSARAMTLLKICNTTWAYGLYSGSF